MDTGCLEIRESEAAVAGYLYRLNDANLWDVSQTNVTNSYKIMAF
jgi:hypothetical protein